MSATRDTRQQRLRRHTRVRRKVAGTAERPRLTVFRSNRNISAQIINDDTGRTLASASSLEADIRGTKGGNKDGAATVGTLLAERAKAAGITTVVFDRGGYRYHGRVAAVADAARAAGLEF